MGKNKNTRKLKKKNTSKRKKQKRKYTRKKYTRKQKGGTDCTPNSSYWNTDKCYHERIKHRTTTLQMRKRSEVQCVHDHVMAVLKMLARISCSIHYKKTSIDDIIKTFNIDSMYKTKYGRISRSIINSFIRKNKGAQPRTKIALEKHVKNTFTKSGANIENCNGKKLDLTLAIYKKYITSETPGKKYGDDKGYSMALMGEKIYKMMEKLFSEIEKEYIEEDENKKEAEEAAKKEAEKKAKEEAARKEEERKRKEEAEKKAKEEAARKEEERKKVFTDKCEKIRNDEGKKYSDQINKESLTPAAGDLITQYKNELKENNCGEELNKGLMDDLRTLKREQKHMKKELAKKEKEEAAKKREEQTKEEEKIEPEKQEEPYPKEILDLCDRNIDQFTNMNDYKNFKDKCYNLTSNKGFPDDKIKELNTMLDDYGKTLEMCEKIEKYDTFMKTCKKVQLVLSEHVKKLHDEKYGEGNKIAEENSEAEKERKKAEEEEQKAKEIEEQKAKEQAESEKKAEEQAELERKAEEQAKTDELAAQCREEFKDFLAKSEDVNSFVSMNVIDGYITQGNDLLKTENYKAENEKCSNTQLNPLNMRIKALEERKQTIKDEQDKCKKAYNGIEKINEINESSEKSILEGIKEKIIALKDGDCKEKEINQETWKKINDKIKEIDDIIQKKTIDEIQPVSPTINTTNTNTDNIDSIDSTTGVQGELVNDGIQEIQKIEDDDPTEVKDDDPTEVKDDDPTEVKDDDPTEVKDDDPTEVKDDDPTEVKDDDPTEVKDDDPTEVKDDDPTEVKDDDVRPGPPPNRPTPHPRIKLPDDLIPPKPITGVPSNKNAIFSFTKNIFEDENAKPSGIQEQAAGHAGTFIKYKPDKVMWTGKVFFNNGESSKKQPKKPKKQCGGSLNPLSSDKCSIKNMVGNLKQQIRIHKLDNIETVELTYTTNETKLIKNGADIETNTRGNFNVQKYNKACVKENMIGILEKSIYELLHNNIDNDALSYFRENLMFKILNKKSKPNKYIYAEDDGFNGKLYFAIENPYETVRYYTQNQEDKKKPVRLYDCKIGKKTVFGEDKGKKATKSANFRDKNVSISSRYGFRLEGVNLDKHEDDKNEYKNEMFNYICTLKEQYKALNFVHLFKPIKRAENLALQTTGKDYKMNNYRIKPMFMFTEMFSHIEDSDYESKHNKRQLLISSMNQEVDKIKEFIKLMKVEEKSRIAFIGSSVSITLNENHVKINIFDFGHPWIYHNNRLLQYPSITDKTFQESCKNYKLVNEDKLKEKALSREEFYTLFPKLNPEYKQPKKKQKFGLNNKKEASLPCIFTMYVFIMQHLYIFEMGLQYLVNIPPPYLPTDDPNDRQAKESRDYDSKYFKKKDYMVKVKQYFTILHNTLNSLTFLYNTLPFITCDKSFKVIDNMNDKNSEIQKAIKEMKQVNSTFKFINDNNEKEEKDEEKVKIYEWTKKNGNGVLKEYKKDTEKHPEKVNTYSKNKMSTIDLIKDINAYNDTPYFPMLDNPEPFKDIAGFINKLKIPVNWLSKHGKDGGKFLANDAKNCINFFLEFYKFYTKPTRNNESVNIQEFVKSSVSDKGGTGEIKIKQSGEINLWSLDINEIILNHTDYNRSINVLGPKLSEKLKNEEQIYNDIYDNYYEGLQSFCDQWDKWMRKDEERINKIKELNDEISKIN